jgi:hypothetical protein
VLDQIILVRSYKHWEYYNNCRSLAVSDEIDSSALDERLLMNTP